MANTLARFKKYTDKLDEVYPVSYTHLDVYKRQPKNDIEITSMTE